MNFFKIIFKNDSFIRGATFIISGNIVGQAIVVISSPILTRIFLPHDFGIFGIYLAIVSFFTLISSFRYELAIILPKNEIIGLALTIISLILVFIVITILIMSIFILGDIFLYYTDSQSIKPYIWLIPFSVFFGGTYKAISYWLLRKKSFNKLFKARLIQDSSMVSAQLILGASNIGVIGLLLGHMIGICAGMVALFQDSFMSIIKLTKKLRWKHILYALIRYKNFPLITIWADMANMASKHFPVIIISGLFSPLYAGYYILANRVGNIPVAVISDGASKAFFAEAPFALKEGYLDKLSINVFTFLMRISFPPFLILAFYAPSMFEFIFGKNWLVAGEYVQALILHMISVFIFIPILTLIPVYEKQRVGFVFQITMLIVSIGTISIGSFFNNVKLALALYGFGTALVYCFFGFLVMNFTGIEYRTIIRLLIKEIFLILPLGAVLFLVKYYFLYSPAILILLYFIGILIIIGLIFRVKYSLNKIIELNCIINLKNKS
jgi:O-antigen/teichoic acid export membrane protein